MKKIYYVMGLVLGWVGCQQCYPAYTRSYTSYVVTPDRTDAKYGYQIDDPMHQLDDAVVESIVGKTLDCIKSLGKMTPQELGQARCVGGQDLAIHSCMIVKIAPDWRWSCRDAGAGVVRPEVFPCTVPASSCLDKGLVPTVECPCSCRAIIQDNGVIVTVPDLSSGVFSAQLITLISGCVNPWSVDRLHKCIFTK